MPLPKKFYCRLIELAPPDRRRVGRVISIEKRFDIQSFHLREEDGIAGFAGFQTIINELHHGGASSS